MNFFTNRAVNTLIRLTSLAAKLVFTLYMGRYLGLKEMGTYGLVAAAVAVLVTVLGLRLDYAVSRDMVDASPREIACKIRDQSVFYGFNYLALCLLMVIAALGPLKDLRAGVILFILTLSVLEHFAAVTATIFVSLNKPVLSNILFFLRGALWTFPAMAMGIVSPAFRTADTVLGWWMAGVTVSLAATAYIWWNLPWREAMRTPVDWGWIKSGVQKCLLIWFGAVGGVFAAYIDRFVVEHYLGLEFVGIASFYGSFVVAITSLMHSGVFAFSFPRLISYHRRDERKKFRGEVGSMTLQAALFSGCICVTVGIAVPLLGLWFHRPEFTTYETTLWLMLLGVWMRSATEGLYYALYARHQDRRIWLGDLLMLIPALGGNLILVPSAGFIGIGYSAVVVALFLCLWRIGCMAFTRDAEVIHPTARLF